MTPELPTVHATLLDDDGLSALARDLTVLAEVLAVIPKAAARGYVSQASLGLEEGVALLRAGHLRGLQVRYRHDGQEWWDTLLAAPGGYRLVRMAQEAT